MIYLLLQIKEDENNTRFAAEILRFHDATLQEVDLANSIKKQIEEAVKTKALSQKPEVKDDKVA